MLNSKRVCVFLSQPLCNIDYVCVTNIFAYAYAYAACLVGLMSLICIRHIASHFFLGGEQQNLFSGQKKQNLFFVGATAFIAMHIVK